MLRSVENARVVAPDGVIARASVMIEDGRIAGVSRKGESGSGALDVGGRFVIPGLVDLHSDAIENQLAPRPEAELPYDLALLEMDRLFASSGITTGFHALTFLNKQDRTVNRARELYALIAAHRRGGMVRHELHLRCELPQEVSVRAVEALLVRGEAGIVSLMDHSLGRGKYKDLGWFRIEYLRDHPRADETDVLKAFGEAVAGPDDDSASLDRVARVASAARDSGTRIFSHDDDSPQKVDLMARHGVSVSEFPIDAATAGRAGHLGLGVCMGAPNVVRGRSTGNSIPAAEAARLGLVDALVSDYHPPSMLQAAFRLAKDKVLPLHEAVGLVSSGPARAAGLEGLGEVREGAVADLVVVGERFGLPAATHAIVGGTVVLASRRAEHPETASVTGAG